MQPNQLESLESVAYTKLAEFIQSERLEKASYLVDILSRLQSDTKHSGCMGRSLLSGSVGSAIPKDLTTAFKTNNYNYNPGYAVANFAKTEIEPQLKDTTLPRYDSLMPPVSEYNWNDGSKDPREDYWRDG